MTAIFAALTCAPTLAPLQAQEAPRLELAAPDAVIAYGFTRVSAIRELSDGRVLVTDRGEERLFVVGFDPSTVEQIGGPGQGPGEYSLPSRLLPLMGDSTIMIDARNNRWHWLDGPVIQETWSARRAPGSSLGVRAAGIDGTGRLLGIAVYRWGDLGGLPAPIGMPELADSTVALLVDGWHAEEPLGVDTLAVLAGGRARSFCVQVRAPDARARTFGGCSPVSGQDMVVPFRDGWIAVVYHDPYRVDWRDPDGRWVRGPLIEHPTRSFSLHEERCVAVRRYPFRGLEAPCTEDLSDRDWPDDVPPFLPFTLLAMSAPYSQTLIPAPDGRLLVRRTPTHDLAHTRYDVIDREGRLDAVIELPSSQAIVGSGVRAVYAIDTGDFDLQSLARHPWP